MKGNFYGLIFTIGMLLAFTFSNDTVHGSTKNDTWISTNSSITDYLSQSDDENIYRFQLESIGSVVVNFTAFTDVGRDSWMCLLFSSDDYGNSVLLAKFGAGKNSNTNMDKYRLPAGTYYIKVISEYYQNFSDNNYTLSVFYSAESPDSYEQEFNDSYAQANTINLGNRCISNLNNANDCDYYQFLLDKSKEITVTFVNDPELLRDYWVGDLYLLETDGRYTKIDYFTAGRNSKTEYTKELDAGTYYLKIYNAYYMQLLNSDYNIVITENSHLYSEDDITDISNNNISATTLTSLKKLITSVSTTQKTWKNTVIPGIKQELKNVASIIEKAYYVGCISVYDATKADEKINDSFAYMKRIVKSLASLKMTTTNKKRLNNIVHELDNIYQKLPKVVDIAKNSREILNTSDIFIEQENKDPVEGTCTLASTTMLLRRNAVLLGKSYTEITENSVKSIAWTDGGIRPEFTYSGVYVSNFILSKKDKKMFLINKLSIHPEGIVIYDSHKPHAVLLTDYDYATDTFYVSDPLGRIIGRVPISESTMKGSGQDGKINHIDKIWLISND